MFLCFVCIYRGSRKILTIKYAEINLILLIYCTFLGKDSCNGDSGGPMTKSFKVDNVKRCYLIGVVSYGRSDCGAGPAVYTLICKYMLTILDNIKE